MPEEEFEGLGDLLSDDGPEMTLADPALMEAGEAIANTIWNAGTEAWNVLLNRGVLYTSGGADYNEPESLLPDDLGECLVTTVEWSGDREGALVFIMPVLFAKGVVAYMMALMMGTEASPEETALDEESMDAFKEAINQFVGSAAQALRQDPGGEVKMAVEEIRVVDFVANTPAMEFGNDFRLCSQGQVTIEGASPVNVYTILSESLTGIETGGGSEAAKSGEIAAAITDAESRKSEEAAALDTGRAMQLRMPVHVTLAERKMRMSDIMQLLPGSIVEFRKSSEEFLDLRVGHITIGRGEAVIVNEHFGLQIREMIDIRTALAAAKK